VVRPKLPVPVLPPPEIKPDPLLQAVLKILEKIRPLTKEEKLLLKRYLEELRPVFKPGDLEITRDANNYITKIVKKVDKKKYIWSITRNADNYIISIDFTIKPLKVAKE